MARYNAAAGGSPALDRLQAKLGGPDFEVIPVSIDQGGSALALIEELFREAGVHHLRIYIDPTGQAASKVGSVGLPTTLLIDGDGKEVGRLIGGAEWNSPEVIAFIERRLARAEQLQLREKERPSVSTTAASVRRMAQELHANPQVRTQGCWR